VGQVGGDSVDVEEQIPEVDLAEADEIGRAAGVGELEWHELGLDCALGDGLVAYEANGVE
jgi:hypothetical protein